MESTKLGLDIGIERSDSSSNRRHSFVTMRWERSDKYITPIQNWKRDDTRMRKWKYFSEIHAYLIPCVNGPTLEKKCTCFSEMSNFITNAYNKACIDMTRYGFLKDRSIFNSYVEYILVTQ